MQGETWGLVVNEAMNFGLPVLVSDMVGCKDDLVEENGNGFVFQTGDLKDLSYKIGTLVENYSPETTMGIESLKIIKNYSYEKNYQQH